MPRHRDNRISAMHPYWQLQWHQARLMASSLRREIHKAKEHNEKFGLHTFQAHSPWIGQVIETLGEQIADLRVWEKAGKPWS